MFNFLAVFKLMANFDNVGITKSTKSLQIIYKYSGNGSPSHRESCHLAGGVREFATIAQVQLKVSLSLPRAVAGFRGLVRRFEGLAGAR